MATDDQLTQAKQALRVTVKMLITAQGIPAETVRLAVRQLAVAFERADAQHCVWHRSRLRSSAWKACRRCGHQWMPKHHVIRRCPKCKSRDWQWPRTTRQGLRPGTPMHPKEDD